MQPATTFTVRTSLRLIVDHLSINTAAKAYSSRQGIGKPTAIQERGLLLDRYLHEYAVFKLHQISPICRC